MFNFFFFVSSYRLPHSVAVCAVCGIMDLMCHRLRVVVQETQESETKREHADGGEHQQPVRDTTEHSHLS